MWTMKDSCGQRCVQGYYSIAFWNAYGPIRSSAERRMKHLFRPVVKLLVSAGVSPNLLSLLGVVGNALSGVLFALDEYRLAGLATLLAGAMDVLDGEVARSSRSETRFGALLDSTLDRYSEMLVFCGLASSSYWEGSSLGFVLLLLSLAGATGSMMVSYIRARAEALGMECKTGLFQRPERVLILGLGSMVVGSGALMILPLAIVAVGTNFTALERLIHCMRLSRGENASAP